MSTPLAPVPAVGAIETSAPTVDFDILHGQARDALDQLRQSQAARQMAMAASAGL